MSDLGMFARNGLGSDASATHHCECVNQLIAAKRTKSLCGIVTDGYSGFLDCDRFLGLGYFL